MTLQPSLKNVYVLVIITVAVHLIYIGVILPGADNAIAAAQSQGQSVPRSLFVILKDFEQEICFIIMFFSVYLIALRYWEIYSNGYLFEVDLLSFSADNDKSAEVSAARKKLDDGHSPVTKTPLVQVIKFTLDRFIVTKSVQNTSEAIESNVEALAISIEAENSLIRYFIWAIPTIGFVGTVRGIGQALAQADQALAGNIAGMTNSLGLAFNSTFVALCISIFLMFLLHQLQKAQDGLVINIREYCVKYIVSYISR